MGYIAPVDFHQYRQYHNRQVTNTNKNNIMLERIFKAKFQEVNRQRKDYTSPEIKPNQKVTVYQSEQSKYVKMDSNELAELTGKGQHFSESI